MRRNSRYAAAATVLLLGGCVTIPEVSTQVDPVQVREKMRVRAALVIPEATRAFDKPTILPAGSCISMGMEFRNNYGAAFEGSVKGTLAQMFDEVTVMRTPPAPGHNYGAVIEATLARLDWRMACMIDPGGYLEPYGSFRALDSTGREIWKSSIEMKRSPAGVTMSMDEFSAFFGRSISALAAAWVAELQASPSVAMMVARVDSNKLLADSQSAEEGRNYPAAIQATRTLLRASPNDARTYARAGYLLARLCDIDGARRAAEEGTQRFAGDAEIALLRDRLAAAAENLGDPVACKAQALNREGVQLAREQKSAEALARFDEAAGLAPAAVPKASYNAGLVLEQSGRAQDALKRYAAAFSGFIFERDEIETLGKMVELAGRAGLAAPDSADQKYRLGIVRTQQKRYQEAVKSFEAALDEAPWIVDAYYNLGLVYDATASYPQALRVLRIYSRLAPRSSNIGAVKTKIVELEDRLGLLAKQ